jgi:plasmid stabilization system protein ParE
VRLRVTTRHADPNNQQELLIYDKARNTYVVKAVQWFDFDIVSPRTGDHFNLVQYQDHTRLAAPLEVVAQLVDKDGNPIAADGILPSAAPGTFVARLTTPANRIEEVPLAVDPRSAGQFRGQLRSAADALSDPPGMYRIRVELKGQYNAGTYSPRRLQAEVRSTGVEQFDFQIVSPVQGQSFNLVHYRSDSPTPEPLAVAVQLTSGDGAPLAPDGVLLNPKQGAFVATLTTPDGRSESVPLELDPVARGLYRASLRSGPDSLADRAGDYRVRVEFNGQTDTDRYTPRKLTAEVLVSGAEVTPIDYQVITTDGKASVASQPLYQGNPACIGAQLLPVRAAITLFDTRHPGQVLDPAQLANGDPARIFSAELVDPASNKETMPLSVQIGEEGLRLVGMAGTTNPAPGPYIVRVVPNPEQFRSNFQLTNTDPLQAKLAREDVPLNRPATCRVGGSTLVGLLGMALVFLIWNMVSRPLGTLSFLHSRTQVILHEEVLGRPLRGWWHTYRSRARNLGAVELSQVKVTRSKGSSKAINLELYDQAGNLVSRETGLSSGDRFELDAQVIVRYD